MKSCYLALALALSLAAAPRVNHRSPRVLCPGGATANYTTPGWLGWSAALPGTPRIVPALSWHLDRPTQRLSLEAQEAELERALAEWSRYVQVTFTKQIAVENTITFSFATGWHGDAYAFDGPSHVLAHAFYPAPINPEPLAGDVHFDDAEDWGGSVDLYTVALHEIGHALGLVHSEDPNAVMFPYYQHQSEQLAGDDVAAIQALYPARLGAPCAAVLDTMALQSPAAGSAIAVKIRTAPDCEWRVELNQAWLSVSPANGIGPALAMVTIQPNPLAVNRVAVARIQGVDEDKAAVVVQAARANSLFWSGR